MRKIRRHPKVWFRAAACCAALLATLSTMQSTVLGQTHDSGGSFKTVTMLLPGQGGPATGILWYGVDEGIFKKHGIDLQIEAPGAVAGASSLPLLDSGKFDVGYASSITMLKDRQENASQLVQFYGLFQSNPNCFFVRKSAGMKSLGQLKGKTIILASSTDNSAMIAMLAKHGVTRTTAKIEYAATSAQFGAFIQGTADAISTYGYMNQPLLRAVNNLDTTTNQATIKALAAAIGETYASAAKNPQVAAAALQRHYPAYTSPVDLTAEIIHLQVVWLTTPNTRKLQLGKMSAADWDTTKQMGVKYFGIHPDLDIADAWTNAAFDKK